MASYKTPNIGLNKWAETDYFKRIEVNENFDKIDDQFSEVNDKIGILNKKTNGVINILEFGAIPNDMNADNYQAIKDAIDYAKANNIQVIDITGGYYRIGRGTGRLGGLELVDISNITIRFFNSYLLMDNLNPTTNNGDEAHGIYIAGNCENITLINPDVRWKTKAASRSQGDGIRVLGGNDPNVVPRNIKIINPYVEKTPQAGIIFYGCKDIVVENARLNDTWADGLHFNACFENIRVEGVYGKNVGDDTVALVTYYSPTDSTTPPFSSPNITNRNNNKTIINGVITDGGNANGVRISGAYDVQVNNVICLNKKAAVIVDSAIANGTSVFWTYLASKKISISNVHSKGNIAGFQVEFFNPTGTVPSGATLADFQEFDVTINGMKEENSTNYGVTLESCKGVTLYNIDCKTYSKFRNVSNISGDRLKFQNGLGIYGTSTIPSSPIANNLAEHNISLGSVEVSKGTMLIQDTKKLRARHIRIIEPDSVGLDLTRAVDVVIDFLEIIRPNRLNLTGASSRALNFAKGQNIKIMQYILSHDANNIRPFEIGGGDAGDISQDIDIQNMVYTNTLNKSTHGVVLQGGSYAPQRWYVDMRYYNGGEPSPKWRYFTRKDVDKGTSSERPTNPDIGQFFFDTTLGKPIWWNGTTWKDATGTTV